jgi:hypothetical protein
MTLALNELYPKTPRCIIFLFDLRARGASEQVHRLRAAWQTDSDLEALDSDHMAVILFPGVGRRLAA